jgi:hypothetical protein
MPSRLREVRAELLRVQAMPGGGRFFATSDEVAFRSRWIGSESVSAD